MGRTLPTYCEHGRAVSGGDFLDDEPCAECQSAQPDSIDAAWAEAEAVLPREALIRVGRTGMTATGWATAYLHGELLGTEFAATPAAALRALTARHRGGS